MRVIRVGLTASRWTAIGVVLQNRIDKLEDTECNNPRVAREIDEEIAALRSGLLAILEAIGEGEESC